MYKENKEKGRKDKVRKDLTICEVRLDSCSFDGWSGDHSPVNLVDKGYKIPKFHGVYIRRAGWKRIESVKISREPTEQFL